MTAKKGLLVVSFGTSYPATRAKTIDRLESDLAAAFPEREFYRAWTSSIIRKKLLKRDHIRVFSVREALHQMLLDGVDDILVQPTHILSGTENDLMMADIAGYRNQFQRVAVGEPLLCATTDYFETIEAIAKAYPVPSDTALVMMGHGTEHYTNSAYAAMDYMLKATGHPQCFVGTVEGYPDFDTLLCQLQQSPYKKLLLIPLMIVAGDHANHDMAGESSDSWKSLFEKAGYEVDYQLKGIGEITAIREIFICHARKGEAQNV